MLTSFKDGDVNCLIATSAFGMGVDISDIRYVIHVGFPLTMMDYVQQCGRGGRDKKGCECLLFASALDIAKTDFTKISENVSYAADCQNKKEGLSEIC